MLALRTGEEPEVATPGADQLDVADLPADDAVELVRRLAPHSAPGVRRELVRGSGGNPLALVEALRALDADQAAGRAPLPVPVPIGRRLERHYAARMRTLPAPTREALLLAAAGSSDLALVRAALRRRGLPDSALEAAERAGLVALQGDLRWHHPLVRSGVYLAAAAAERRRAHRVLAAAAAEAGLADHRAWHLAAAATGRDETVAAALHAVARDAHARGAPQVAVHALERASAMTPDPEARARRLVEAASVAVSVGRSSRAAALATEAIAGTGDPYLKAQGERLRARASLAQGHPADAYRVLLALGAAWERRDPALAASILSDCVVLHMADGDTDGYLRTARRALRAARRAGPEAEALPSLLLALGLVGIGRGPRAVALLDRHRGLAERAELWTEAPEIAGMVALAQLWIGRHDEVARLLAAPIARARDTGQLRALSFPLAVSSDLELRLGRLATARAEAAEAVRAAEDAGDGTIAANNVAYLARAEAALGDADACRAHAERSLRLSSALGLGAVRPYAHHALGLLELSLGRPGEAAIHLQRAAAPPAFAGEPGLALWLGDLAEAHARAGRAAEARSVLAQLERHVARTRRAHGRAVAARVRGMLAPDDEIDGAFARASRWHAAAGMPMETARSLLCHGERLRRVQRRVDARPVLGEALAAFEAMGAVAWAERAREELHAAGRRGGPRPVAQARSPWAALTAREAQVARAILDGATYREAAQALFVSPRTVEHHLREAYRKLGVRSRSELTVLLRDAPAPAAAATEAAG